MKRNLSLLLACCVMFAFAVAAHAKKRGKVTIVNCAKKDKIVSGYKWKATVCVYDGGDVSKSTARHRKTLIPGKTWETWCKGRTGLKYNTKRCKVYLVPEAGNACPINGASGKRLVRAGWNSTVYIGLKNDKLIITVGSKTGCDR